MSKFQEEMTKEYYPVSTLDRRGKRKKTYVYRGDYSIWEAELDTLRRHKKKCVLLYLAAVVFWLIGAFINIDYNQRNLTVVPTICALIPLLFQLHGLILLLLSTDDKMPESDCKNLVEKIVIGAAFSTALNGCSALAVLWYLLSCGFVSAAILCIAAYILAAACNLLLHKMQKNFFYLTFSIQEPPDIYRERHPEGCLPGKK